MSTFRFVLRDVRDRALPPDHAAFVAAEPPTGRVIVIAPTRAACETIELALGLHIETLLEREHGAEIRELARAGRGQGAGDTAVHELLNNHPDRGAADEETWEREYEQRLLEWAAARVRAGFQESTWQAFWKTAVEGENPQAVAEQLGISTGAVYIAKSRVIAQLKAKVERQLGEKLQGS